MLFNEITVANMILATLFQLVALFSLTCHSRKSTGWINDVPVSLGVPVSYDSEPACTFLMKCGRH